MMRGERQSGDKEKARSEAESNINDLLKKLVGKIQDGTISIIKHDSLIIQIDTHEVLTGSELQWLSRIGG